MKRAITNEFGELVYIDFTAVEIAAIEAQRLAEFEASWLHKARPIRVGISDSDYIALLIDYPQFALIRQEQAIPVESQLGFNYIYLEELFPEDRALFEYFGGSNSIESYQPN